MTPEIIDHIDQGTDDWKLLRCGSIGGAGINIVASKGSGRESYLYKKAGELVSHVPEDDFDTWQFRRGREWEPVARERYEAIKITEVRQIAMAKLTDHKHFSPDGIVDEDGFIEIKVRIPSVFLRILNGASIATNERRQIQWGFRVMGKKWCHHIDFCPEIDKANTINPMIIKTVYPDPDEIRKLNAECDKFIGEMKTLVEKFK